MSNRLFGVNNPVTHCATKRVRRTWGGTVLTMLTLLLLAALCGWLWSCVRHAVVPSALVAPQQGYLLAMAPVWQGSILGLLLFFSTVLIVLAVRKVKRDEEFFARLRERQVLSKQRKLRARREFWEKGEWPHDVPPFTVGPLESLSESETPAVEPLEDEAGGLDHAEMHRILVSCAAEGREIQRRVQHAQMTLSVEDYEDALHVAHDRLTTLVACVEALCEHFPPVAPAPDLVKTAQAVAAQAATDTAAAGGKASYEELQQVIVDAAQYMNGEVSWEEAGRLCRILCEAAERLHYGKGAAS